MPHINRHLQHEYHDTVRLANKARSGILPWIYWGIAASFYLYEFFARVAPSTFEWQLQKNYSLDASELGFIMGLYYLAYAPMQLIVGIALDRFGSKRLLSSAAIIAGLGCLVFAHAGDVLTLALGRVMLGIGSSFAFVGAVYIATVWFPKRRLALIMGMTAALGTLGAALGEAPLREAVETYGFKEAMYTAALVGLAISILIFIIVPKRPRWFLQLAKMENRESTDNMFKGLREVVSCWQTWLVAIISLLMYVPISTFGALWGISYVSTAADVPKEEAAWAMTMLFLGFAAGAPLLGFLSDKWNIRRMPIMLGSGLCACSMGMILLAPYMPFWLTTFFLISTGFFAGAQAITFALSVEQHGTYCKATAVAFVNFFVMLGGFMLQPVFGAILDVTTKVETYTVVDFQKALVILPISIALGTVLCFWLKDTSET